jgi:flagellar hook-associated protein FlgK
MPAITQAARDYDEAMRRQFAMAAEEDALKMQKLRLEIQKMDEESKKNQPGYSAEVAAGLGRKLEESERNLQLQDELLSDLSKRKQNISAAATPLQPQIAGPVMPQQAAIGEMNRIGTAEEKSG